MHVEQFRIEGLGHLSTLIADDESGEAAIVDPRRDVDIYLDRASAAGLRISHVLETHLHNDYVSGARQLAALTGAEHLIGAGAELRYDHRPMRDREAVAVGRLRIRALDTPGHTPEHVAYSVADTSRAEEPVILMTGGSLLVGSVGRTDLLGEANAVPFARAMHRSLHDVVMPHEDFVGVMPTHGAGSLCSTATASTPSTTIGFERRYNPLLRIDDPDEFARQLLHGQPAFPRYFARMRPLNQAGPSLVGARPPMPPPVSADAARAAVADGALIVDLRPERDFAAGHPPGALSIAAGDSFGTWLGWVVDPDRPIILLLPTGSSAAAAKSGAAANSFAAAANSAAAAKSAAPTPAPNSGLDDAVRQAWRVGHESIAGFVEGGWPAWTAAGAPVESTPALSVDELARIIDRPGPDGAVVVDVRQATEFDAGHVPGAWHIMAGWLPDRLSELPRDRPIATMCASGFRASVAASLLRAAGFGDVSWVDGGFGDWAAAGYPAERGG